MHSESTGKPVPHQRKLGDRSSLNKLNNITQNYNTYLDVYNNEVVSTIRIVISKEKTTLYYVLKLSYCYYLFSFYIIDACNISFNFINLILLSYPICLKIYSDLLKKNTI